MKPWTAAVGLALGIVPAAQAQGTSSVAGEWWTPGFNARVRIEPCGDAVCGRIVWLWDETPKDIADKNPLVGRQVIERMQAAEPGFWRSGRLYNPEDGRDYKGSLHLQSPNRLVVDGCVLFICRTQVWRRADPARCPPVAPTDARGTPG
jgi:uncharacterized protein (DUF2147 family)